MIINQVGGGKKPSGTKQITTNGTHDVAGYANADVQVPTTAPASYRAFQKNASGTLVNSTSTPWVPLPTGTTNLDDNILMCAYQNTPANVLSGSIDLSSLTTLSNTGSLRACFQNCTGLTSVDLSSLTTVSGGMAMLYCFSGCTGLTSVDLSSLTTLTATTAMQYCFSGCTGLTSVDLSSLTTLTGLNSMQFCFYGCTGLTSVNLSSLTTVSANGVLQNCFAGCTSLAALSFPALTSTSFGSQTNQFNNMLSGVTGCTVHFPSNLQSVIGSWASVTAGFSGTNTTVLFDLPATE